MTRDEALQTLRRASSLRERIKTLSAKIERETYQRWRVEMIRNKAKFETELNELKPARREAMKLFESCCENEG